VITKKRDVAQVTSHHVPSRPAPSHDSVTTQMYVLIFQLKKTITTIGNKTKQTVLSHCRTVGTVDWIVQSNRPPPTLHRSSKRDGCKRCNNQHRMVYRNQNVRMGKKQAVNADEGTASFFKNGADGKRLRALMLSKGADYNQVTLASVLQEDGFFATFKSNSIKANITLLKSEFNQRVNVEGLSKFLLLLII
jgi:hypothetical protein